MTAVIVPPALDAAAAEAKAYLRVTGADEDALIERLIGSSAALCEAFTGRWLLAREGAETIPASAVWRRLRATPIGAILSVETVSLDGTAALLPTGAYAIDIDANGDGWVRVMEAGPSTSLRTKRVRVRFQAGMASEWEGLPDALRQGIVRLTAHLFTHRSDARDAGPPAAVTALWRPWRRMPFGLGGRDV